ncbi:hypothetical protein PVL29_012252 [Vitis rotundifolia]|uniref:Uncharacterized protein n=1 Tax=Vitis rotundifolia TaxID=103349 RepID=A0AA39DRW4_VITRO|nr:hypothetical protein PVL29_012252 [Vitis rotundifolia]
MSPIEEGFSFEPKAIVAAGVGDVGLDGEFGPSAEQAFFEGERSIALEVISSFFSSSQIIGGTNWFTPTSTSSLEDEEDKEDEEDEADDKNEATRGKVLTF